MQYSRLEWSRERALFSLGLGSCDADHCTSWQGRRGCSCRSQSYSLFPYTQWEYVSFQIGAIVDYLLSGRGAGGTEFGRGWEYGSAGGATDRVLTVVVSTREGEFSDLEPKGSGEPSVWTRFLYSSVLDHVSGSKLKWRSLCCTGF